jgi:hypothetical protein
MSPIRWFPPRTAPHHPAGGRLAVASLAVVLTAAALPVATAVPAAAQTTHGRCTVTPLDPVVVQNGQKLNFRIEVLCEAGRTIEVKQSLWEQDSGPRDSRGEKTHKKTFNETETVVIDHVVDAFNTESGAEEVFQEIQFRTSRGQSGNWNAWTAPEASKVTVLPQATGTTHGRCTVKPLDPVVLQNGSKLDFPVQAFCEAGRTIEVKQSLWEQDKDEANNDARGTFTQKKSFDRTNTIVLRKVVDAFNTESGGEEVFHEIQFRTSRGQAGNWTAWTAMEASKVVPVPES